MGFSGGGSNVLKNHKHDATVVQDGGSLDADNVTSADLTAGDVIYSDGAHLQRLAIGTPAQQIQVNAGATAPEYFTPAAGASVWTELYNSGKILGAGNLDSGTFASHDMLYISSFAALSVANGQGIKFNNDSGNNYQGRDGRDGAWNTVANNSCILYTFGTSDHWTNSTWFINQKSDVEKLVSGFTSERVAPGSIPSQDLSTWQWDNTTANITRVEITNSTSVTSSCKIGSQLVVLGAS